MIISLLTFIIWIPAILGIGNLTYIPYQRLIDRNQKEHFLEQAVLGMAILSALANLLNFFTGISTFLQLIILIGGWSRFIYGIRSNQFEKPGKFLLTGVIIWGLLLIFLRTITAPDYYDTGYYGLQTVQWYNNGPLPLGLAHLHSRFAYNSAWLAFSSVIQFPTLEYYISGEILQWFMGFMVIQAIEKSLYKEWTVSTLYGLLIPLILLTPVLGTFTISALATDLPVFWLTIMLGWIGIQFAEHRASPAYVIWFTTNLILFGISIKLSAAPLLITIAGLFFGAQKDIRHQTVALIKAIIPSSALILLPWLMRFFWMSGCLVYPVSFTCLPSVPWAIPVDSVSNMAAYIQQFAISRNLFPIKIASPWLLEPGLLTAWIKLYFGYSETYVLLLFLMLSFGIYLASIKSNHQDRQKRNEIIFFIPYITGIIFWFFSAPDVRFGSGYFWGLTLLWFSFGIFYLGKKINSNGQGLILAVMQISVIGILVIFASRTSLNINRIQEYWLLPSQAPAAESNLHSIDGVLVHTPVKSDLLCWGETLPCTPELHPDLRIKTDGNGNIEMFYLSPNQQ